MVVLISYGCMGRSARQDSTASANGLLTFRRGMASPRARLLDPEYQSPSTRCQEVSPRTAGGPKGGRGGVRGVGRARGGPGRRSVAPGRLALHPGRVRYVTRLRRTARGRGRPRRMCNLLAGRGRGVLFLPATAAFVRSGRD